MMNYNTVVIFFSKDRAMQLDAAIRSCRAHCEDLSSVEKLIVFRTSSKIHADQYKQLQHENPDFRFVEENSILQQILSIASPFKFISFHCDDNLYMRPFSFLDAERILSENKSVLGHSFRLGKNVKYSYTRNSPEPQPVFFDLGQKVLRFNWAKMEPRGFGYPLEVSASVYRCEHILPILSRHQSCPVGHIETRLMECRKEFLVSFPFFTCGELPSIISVPVNKVGIVNNKAGEKHSYSVEDLAHKFSENLRIDISQFSGYISEATHIELEFSFERKNK